MSKTQILKPKKERPQLSAIAKVEVFKSKDMKISEGWGIIIHPLKADGSGDTDYEEPSYIIWKEDLKGVIDGHYFDAPVFSLPARERKK